MADIPEELQQRIEDLQNQINDVRSLVGKDNFSNTFIQDKNMIQNKGYFQSPNFVSGVSGWRLTAEGDFEGNTGTFRGSVTGATFTGGTFQTSTTGQRIVIDSSGTIKFYDASGGYAGYLSGYSGAIVSDKDIVTYKNLAFAQYGYYLRWQGTDALTMLNGSAITAKAHILPFADSSYNLGADDNRWEYIYGDNFPASPIKVSSGGIESFKKIKDIKDNTLQTTDLPDEFTIEINGEKHTEIKRSVGLCIQAIKELTKKVEDLESKIK
jgi:hypothetical protein